jgi:hypothetical protein
MKHRPLILAPSTDPHACALAWAIERQGTTPIWTPSLPTQPGTNYAFHIDPDHEYLQDSLIGDDVITAVWNRRLHDPVPTCAEADRNFANWEWKMFQRSLFSLDATYGDALWVNRANSALYAENKLVQLSTCRRLGLPFPETVVTTDAAEVDALRKRWGRIIFKSFLVHQWEDRTNGKLHAVGVTLLDENSDLPADAIAVCPGIYQRYIEKAFDVRVTVIGDHLFAMSLGNESGAGYVDWRTHSADPELHARAITLPAAVEDKVRAFMRELDLVFGCVDLVVDKDGQFLFLEVNQAGQFLFVEEMLPEYPILQTMTALLTSGRRDCSIGTLEPVTMKDFWTSDSYARLKEHVEVRLPERPLFTLE